ncbi:MAG: hypothetical protein NTX25_17700 [Proteobacteria bacterium]|nr:hypothetical protein [Pseudomonadota bacterium]
MNANAEASSKITNPERISRIISRMCDGHMQVILRTKNNINLGIRANFSKLYSSKNSSSIEFNQISKFGLEKLSAGMLIKVEVIGMPSKVTFVASITELAETGVLCSFPNTLVTIERRQNSRYKVNPSSMAYLSFSVWAPEVDDPSSPPFFEAYRSLANLVPIADMSNNGICIQSHFPSFINVLDNIELDPKAGLHLPMSPPIAVKAVIRWKRRIKNRIVEDKSERYQLDYRVGIELIELHTDQQLKIRSFLRALSMADAI